MTQSATETQTSLSGAYGGEKWSPRTEAFREDMPEVWGDWGSGSECGTLRAVLLSVRLYVSQRTPTVRYRTDGSPLGAMAPL